MITSIILHQDPTELRDKSYLGDSVYAYFDGHRVWLTTENGLPDDPSNKICFEPGVLIALDRYRKLLKDKYYPEKENDFKA